MESDRFDRLAKIVVRGSSRRAALGGVLGGVVGTALGRFGPGVALPSVAIARPKSKKKGCKGSGQCKDPENPCQQGVCRNRKCRIRNRANGTPCGDETICRDGECDAPCDAVCTGGQICRSDECVCPESGECTVSPTHPGGWSFPADEKVTFVTGPDTPPLGAGSVRLSTVDNLGSAIANDLYDGVPIGELDPLGFATYTEDGDTAEAGVPALELTVLYDGGMASTTLVFEPANSVGSDVTPDVWQTWDALGPNARWWSSKEIPGICEESCLATWAEVLAAIPDAEILGLLAIRSGSGATDAAGHVDAVQINGLIYDFERDA